MTPVPINKNNVTKIDTVLPSFLYSSTVNINFIPIEYLGTSLFCYLIIIIININLLTTY